MNWLYVSLHSAARKTQLWADSSDCAAKNSIPEDRSRKGHIGKKPLCRWEGGHSLPIGLRKTVAVKMHPAERRGGKLSKTLQARMHEALLTLLGGRRPSGLDHFLGLLLQEDEIGQDFQRFI